MISKYELTFLLKEETELPKIKQLIESFSGKILSEERWGEITLSYPIKKNRTVIFFNWQIELDKKNVLEFRKKLNFEEKVLRYLLLIKN
jgi:ribosomal protein S6